jgi:hypothetical protein
MVADCGWWEKEGVYGERGLGICISGVRLRGCGCWGVCGGFQALAGFEQNDAAGWDGCLLAGLGVAAEAGGFGSDVKCAEAAEDDRVAVLSGILNLIQDCLDHIRCRGLC